MSRTLQGKYADKLNKQIEELYKVIDAKDKIINEQVLKIEDLQQKIDNVNKYINDLLEKNIEKNILEAIKYMLGDKDNE